MARELDSVQAERAGRSHIAPVALVKLTTYTNRVAETGPKVFYFSNLPCTYDYGNTATDQIFLPVILGGGDFSSGLRHIPEPDDLTSFSQSFDLRLSNYPINGSRLIALLQAHNLEGARIEIAQLLIPEIGTLPLDLTAYTGDEHTVLFRGRVNRVAPITNSMVTIQCTTELPNLAGSWVYASDDTKVDPVDLGKRYPRIYGSAKRIPAVAYEVGWTGTMVDALDASEVGAGYEISDGSGLPSGDFTIRIDSEEIDCSTAAATTLTIVTREANSTTASVHVPGALFLEMVTTPKWILSDRQSDAVQEVYALNPINGMLLRLDSSVLDYTTTLNESILGGTMTTLSFTSTQMSELLEYFAAQAAATIDTPGAGGATSQQPISLSGNPNDPDDAQGGMDRVYENDNNESPGVAAISGLSMTFEFPDPGVEFNSQYCEVWVTEAFDDPAILDVKVNGNIVGSISVSEQPGYGGTPLKRSFNTEHTGDITIDPTGSGKIVVFNCERILPIVSSETDERGISSTASSGDETDLIDGLTTTGITAPAVPWNCTVTFPTPSFPYHSQRIRVYAKFEADKLFNLQVDDVDLAWSPGHSNNDEPNAGWHEWETDLQGDTIKIDHPFSSTFATIREIERTLIYYGTPPSTISASYGFGLRFFADVDGVEAPDGNYDASVDAVMVHPADIMKHWITVIGGETLDSDTYDALVISLGASEWGFDARSLGFTWEEVLQRMAFEARTNVIPVETSTGREWKLLAAEHDYGFNDDAIATITQTHDMIDTGRSVDDIASYFSFRYAFDASLPGGGNEESFKLALDANPSVSDVPITADPLILAASARFGAVESGPIAFRCIQDPDTAKDVAGYYVQERMANDRRVYELRGVAWFDALPYDVGDIVSITAPWSASATTCRITSMQKAFESNAWTITAVEVLTDGNGLRT